MSDRIFVDPDRHDEWQVRAQTDLHGRRRLAFTRGAVTLWSAEDSPSEIESIPDTELRKLYPELFALTLSIQDPQFHPEKDRFGHHSVWQHTKITVDQAARLADAAGWEKPLKLALLFAESDAGAHGLRPDQIAELPEAGPCMRAEFVFRHAFQHQAHELLEGLVEGEAILAFPGGRFLISVSSPG